MSTPQTNAPEWAASQGSPWLIANKAFRIFDAFCTRTSIEDRDLASPPVTCGDGDRYLVAAGASGAWLGEDGNLAIAQGGNASNGWYFANIDNPGNTIYVRDEGIWLDYIDGEWTVSAERITFLADLRDVDISGLNDGDTLRWDASNQQWYSGAPASLTDLSDVDLSGGIPDGYVLKYDLSSGQWFPSADSSSGGINVVICTVTLGSDATANYTGNVIVGFNTDIIDTNNCHDTVTNNSRITCPFDLDEVTLSAQFYITGATAADWHQITFTHNYAAGGGDTIGKILLETAATSFILQGISRPVSAAMGDWFTVSLQNQSDTSITITSGATSSWFGMRGLRVT